MEWGIIFVVLSPTNASKKLLYPQGRVVSSHANDINVCWVEQGQSRGRKQQALECYLIKKSAKFWDNFRNAFPRCLCASLVMPLTAKESSYCFIRLSRDKLLSKFWTFERGRKWMHQIIRRMKSSLRYHKICKEENCIQH